MNGYNVQLISPFKRKYSLTEEYENGLKFKKQINIYE